VCYHIDSVSHTIQILNINDADLLGLIFRHKLELSGKEKSQVKIREKVSKKSINKLVMFDLGDQQNIIE
jgi:hypothetical protein